MEPVLTQVLNLFNLLYQHHRLTTFIGLTSQGDFNFVDGSDHLFTMYNEISAEEDEKMVERWKGDADGILVFVSPYITPDAMLRT
jgi:hypothetical protein